MIDTSVTCPKCGYGSEPAYMMEQPRIFTKQGFVRLEAEVAKLTEELEKLRKALDSAIELHPCFEDISEDLMIAYPELYAYLTNKENQK